MDNFYCETSLDFIALESAMMNYETVNNLDEIDMSISEADANNTDENPAVESSTSNSDFVFGVGLFEETVANESTYSTEPAMEGIGGKIWGAIKSFFAAIVNFFKGLSKKTEETTKKVEANAAKAKEVMSGATTNVTTSGASDDKPAPAATADSPKDEKGETATKSDTKSDKRAKAEAKLKAAAAGEKGEGTITPVTGSEGDYNKGYSKGVPKQAGSKLQGAVRALSQAISKYTAAIGAALNATTANEIKTICNRIDAAMKKAGHTDKTEVSDADVKKFHTAYNRNGMHETKNSGNRQTNMIKDDADKLGDIVSGAEKRAEELEKMRNGIYDQYAVIEKEWKNDGYVITVIKGGDKSRGAKLDLKTYVQLDYYTQNQIDNVLRKTCNEVMAVANKNISYCTQMMNVASQVEQRGNNDAAAANSVFRLCKSYLAISKVYGKFSMYLSSVCTGDILRSAIYS